MHIPVMLNEVVQALEIKSDGIYVDVTVGYAGHAQAILKLIPQGKLIGLDKDQTALMYAKKILQPMGTNFTLIHSDFRHLKTKLAELGISQIDGLIADLGLSSPQIHDPDRGFSYAKVGLLDMRMDQSQILKAADVVNEWSKEQLVTIFKNYADVKNASQIANAIIENRPIATTLELVEIIKSALPAKLIRQKNPAKAVFQAIRIAVNDEFAAIKVLLKDAISLLKPQGVLALISFHSLEDKLIKEFIGPLMQPQWDYKVPLQEKQQFKTKTVYPAPSEVLTNYRSRSAKLRILKKLI